MSLVSQPVHCDEEEEESLLLALQLQLNQTPWYIGSGVIHLVVLLLLILLCPPKPTVTPPRPFSISPSFVDDAPVDTPVETPPDPTPPVEAVDVTQPVELPDVILDVPEDVDVTNQLDPIEDPVEMAQDNGPADFSQMPDNIALQPALLGVGDRGPKVGGPGTGSGFEHRKPSHRRRPRGPQREMDIVDDWGLQWLAAHQEADGHWDARKYGGDNSDVGVTSLALLAFLGDGNSTRSGDYRDNVRRATSWLISQQQSDGRIGPHSYQAGIACMALVESYGMSMDKRLQGPAQRTVNYVCASQCPAGAWDYKPRSKRVDTSVTGWYVMALKSARMAGLQVPTATFDKALAYLQKATDTASGSVTYSADNVADLQDVPAGKNGSHRLSAVALTCLQFLGRPLDDPQVLACAERTGARLPDAGRFDFYEWYYQTLGLYQLGTRNPYWKRFLPAMKEALVTTQIRTGTVKECRGSWNPDTDHYGAKWGRVGQTALACMMLQIFHRYGSLHGA